MKTLLRPLLLASGLLALAAAPATRAADFGLSSPGGSLRPFDPTAVTPGSTFGIAVTGFNFNDPSDGIFLTNVFNPVFGTTQTFTGGGLGGNVTVSSSQVIGTTTTTDTFTISTPTNFVPAGTTTNGGAPSGSSSQTWASSTPAPTRWTSSPPSPRPPTRAPCSTRAAL